MTQQSAAENPANRKSVQQKKTRADNPPAHVLRLNHEDLYVENARGLIRLIKSGNYTNLTRTWLDQLRSLPLSPEQIAYGSMLIAFMAESDQKAPGSDLLVPLLAHGKCDPSVLHNKSVLPRSTDMLESVRGICGATTAELLERAFALSSDATVHIAESAKVKIAESADPVNLQKETRVILEHGVRFPLTIPHDFCLAAGIEDGVHYAMPKTVVFVGKITHKTRGLDTLANLVLQSKEPVFLICYGIDDDIARSLGEYHKEGTINIIPLVPRDDLEAIYKSTFLEDVAAVCNVTAITTHNRRALNYGFDDLDCVDTITVNGLGTEIVNESKRKELGDYVSLLLSRVETDHNQNDLYLQRAKSLSMNRVRIQLGADHERENLLAERFDRGMKMWAAFKIWGMIDIQELAQQQPHFTLCSSICQSLNLRFLPTFWLFQALNIANRVYDLQHTAEICILDPV